MSETPEPYDDDGGSSAERLDLRDLHDPDHLMRITKDLYEAESNGVSSLADRVSDMVLMRESGANDWLDAEGLIQQAAALYSEIDGIEAVARLGVEPLKTKRSTLEIVEDPDSDAPVVTVVHVSRLRVGKTSGVLFSYRGTAYLYSLASAATVDQMGQQDWTRMLIRELVRLRPRRLRAVSVSRYTRNLEVAGLLLHAASQHVDEVWAGPLELTMRGPRAPMDKLLFVMLAMAAALERDALVSRMMAGKVNAARKNRWLQGARRVPPGYRMAEGNSLVPAPEERERVQAILRLIASRPTTTEFVKRLGALGLKLAPISGVEGERSVEFTHGRNTKKRQFYALVPLWITGQKVVKLPNPFPGAKELGGMPVVRGRNGREEVHIVCDFGLPPGGWADEDLLNAAFAAAVEWSDSVARPLGELSSTEVHGLVMSIQEDRQRGQDRQKAPEALPWCGSTWEPGDGHVWGLFGRGTGWQLVRTLRPSNGDVGAAEGGAQ
jgi:hypothetical protein